MPRFRPSVLMAARERAGLSRLELAKLADAAAPERHRESGVDPAGERVRRIRTWESRIGAWERGIDAPSASYIPTLAQLLKLDPVTLFDVDAAELTFTAMRMTAGLTLQALAATVGIPYTPLYRMVRGVTRMPDDAAARIATALGVMPAELRAAIERDR